MPKPYPARPARRFFLRSPRQRRLVGVCGRTARLATLVSGVVAGLALAAGPAPWTAAAEPRQALLLDAASVWEYAETLLRQGEYFRAVSEYKRLAFYFPADPRALQARLRVGEAYLRAGEPDLAIEALGALLAEPALAQFHDDGRYLRGLAWLERDRDLPYPLREASIAAALKDLRAIAPEWPGAGNVRGFVEAISHPPAPAHKSPGLAAGLSAVVPGAGSFYVGRFAEGSLAFFVTGVLLYGAVNSFQADHVAGGTALGALALAFYGGSIYAAANGAHKFNDRARGNHLLAERRRFGLVLAPGAIGGAFNRNY